MKKIFVKLLFLSLLFNNLYAVILTQDVIDDYINKENTIRNYVATYVLETAKVPNKNDLNNYFKLNDNLYNNIYAEVNQINFSINENNNIIINYPIYSQFNLINQETKSFYLKSTKHNPLTLISPDYSFNITPFEGKVANTIIFIKNLQINEQASVLQPTDISITSWYYPNGDGTFKLYKKNSSGKWILTDFNSNIQVLDYNTTSFNINETCTNDNIAMVSSSNSTTVKEYVCIEGKWYDKNSNADNSNTMFKGYTTLQNTVCNMWDKAGGSIVYDIPTHPFSSTDIKSFTKFDDSDGIHGGYWISSDFKDIITRNMTDLTYYRTKYGTQTTGYMCFNNKVIYAKWIPVNNNNQWVYIPKDYNEMYFTYKTNVLNFNDNSNIYLSWDYIVNRDNLYKQIFQLTPLLKTTKNNIHYSQFQFDGDKNNVINKQIQITDTRENFTSFLDDVLYLTEFTNCNNNCYNTGLDETTGLGTSNV